MTTMNLQDRIEAVAKLGQLFKEQNAAVGELISKGMNKPIRQATGESIGCYQLCKYFASVAEDMLKPSQVDGARTDVEIWYEPLGTVLGIMPFNYPLWQIIRFAMPPVLAGNKVFVRADECIWDGVDFLNGLIAEAGLEGHFELVRWDHAHCENLIKNRRVQGVGFTGSVRTGSHIAKMCGEALIPYSLELGGSDAYIILDDADISGAAKEILTKRFENGGQSCISPKRILVSNKMKDTFVKEMKVQFEGLAVGTPDDPSAYIGPMVNPRAKSKLSAQLAASTDGAGDVFQHPGIVEHESFLSPTVIVDPPAHSPARKEELFGPVAVVIGYEDEAEAVKIANETEFGLGGAVFSGDIDKAKSIAAQMETGMVSINKSLNSHPAVPFRGIKTSGIGFECGPEALRFFTTQKVVWL